MSTENQEIVTSEINTTSPDTSKPVTPSPTDKVEQVEKVETKTEPTPEQVKEQLRAKQIATHLKKESEFLKAKTQWQEEQKQKEAYWKEQETTYKAQVQEIEKVKTQLADFLVRLRDNPVQVLQEEFGYGPEEYYQHALQGGKPSKEEIALRELRDENLRVKREVEEMKAWRAQQEEARKQAEIERKRQEEEGMRNKEVEAAAKARELFLKEVRDPSKYPDLKFYDDEELVEAAIKIVEANGGVETTLSYNDLAAQLQQATSEWHSKLKGSAAPQVEVPKVENSESGTKAEVDEIEGWKPSPKPKKTRRSLVDGHLTLSNEMSQRTSVKTPLNSFEEQKRQLIAELEAGKA